MAHFHFISIGQVARQGKHHGLHGGETRQTQLFQPGSRCALPVQRNLVYGERTRLIAEVFNSVDNRA